MFHVEHYFSTWKSVFEASNCSTWNIGVLIGGGKRARLFHGSVPLKDRN
jgi:hypothetical protein